MFQQILKKRGGYFIFRLDHMGNGLIYANVGTLVQLISKCSAVNFKSVTQAQYYSHSKKKSQIVRRLQMNRNRFTLTRQPAKKRKNQTIPRFNLTERSPRARHREGAVLHCVQQRSLRVAENSRSGTQSASQATFFVKIKRRIKNYVCEQTLN